MALTAPNSNQKRFAGQLAWERGKKIATWPETSSALSGLISSLLSMPALPIADWQVDQIRRLVQECAAKVQGFDPTEFSELPSDRAVANKVLYTLRKRLNAVEYRAAQASASSYLVDEDSPEAQTAALTQSVEDSRLDDTDVPL